MTDKEKILLLEETFDVDEDTLNPEMILDELEEYDSMTRLSIIVMIDENFGKKISGSDLKTFKTIRDIMKVMEK